MADEVKCPRCGGCRWQAMSLAAVALIVVFMLRRLDDGVLTVGDAAGFIGIIYALESIVPCPSCKGTGKRKE